MPNISMILISKIFPTPMLDQLLRLFADANSNTDSYISSNFHKEL